MLILNPLNILFGLALLALGIFATVANRRGKVKLPRGSGRGQLNLSPAGQRRFIYAVGAIFVLSGVLIAGNEIASATTAREVKATCSVSAVNYQQGSSSRRSHTSSWWKISTSCGELRSESQPQVSAGRTYRFDYYTSRNLFGFANMAHLLGQPQPVNS